MKFTLAPSSLLLFVAATVVVALTDKQKAALTNFDANYHPGDHALDTLVKELSDYASDAGLSTIKNELSSKQYGPAGRDLTAHTDSLKSDPLVQKGKEFHEAYMMLDQCVTEFKDKTK